MTIISRDYMSVINKQAGRMSLKTEHGEAELLYRIRGKVMVIYHTFMPVEDRGYGKAAKLAKEAFAFAKKNGLKVRPDCPYIGHFVEEHKEYAAELV